MARKVSLHQALSEHFKFRPYSEVALSKLQATDEDSRGVAVIAGTVLEQALEELISAQFKNDVTLCKRKLFEGDNERDGIVGSLHAKIWIGYAIGLIGEQTRDDFLKIKSIRNVFAHSADFTVSFETKSISDQCNFYILDRYLWGGISGEQPTTAVQKYIGCVKVACRFMAWSTRTEHAEGDDDNLKLWAKQALLGQHAAEAVV